MNTPAKKRKLSFNFIDVALIVIALAGIAVLVFFFSKNDIVSTNREEKVNIEYTVRLSPVREEYINLIKIGDTLINTDIMQSVGEVTNVTNSDCLYEGYDSTGAPVYTPYPGMKTVVVTIRAEAIKTKTGYIVNGYDVVIGESMTFRVPDFTGTGVCVSISESKV